MDFNKGVSMLELLIALGIIAAVSVVLGSVYFVHAKLFNRQVSLTNVATQNKLALDEMRTTIRESKSLVASCCTPTETASSQVLVLQIWPLNSSGEPTDTISGYDYIIYKRDPNNNTKLLKKVVPATGSFRPALSKILANNIGLGVDDVKFEYVGSVEDATEVNITLTTSQVVLKQTQTNTQSIKAGLRNK